MTERQEEGFVDKGIPVSWGEGMEGSSWPGVEAKSADGGGGGRYSSWGPQPSSVKCFLENLHFELKT